VEQVAGVLLAAGGGRRLGGRAKALLPFRGRPLVEHQVATLRAGGCADLYVVLGAARAQVLAAADLTGYHLVSNDDWPSGMGSSLRAALLALPPTVTAALVLLVDQPGITAAAVRRVRDACTGPASLAVATYGGQRGHPVLLGRDHWPAVLAAATGDRGARAYLDSAGAAVHPVPCDDVATPRDIDLPADLDTLDGPDG